MGHADLVQVVLGLFQRFFLRYAQDMHGGFDNVFQRGHVRPQVEVLEHHRQPRAHALQLFRVGGLHRAVLVRHQLQLFVVEQDPPGVGLFQQVDAAQEGTFAGATGADDADHITRLGGQGHPLEHFVTAIAFMQVLDFKLVHAVGSHKNSQVSR